MVFALTNRCKTSAECFLRLRAAHGEHSGMEILQLACMLSFAVDRVDLSRF